MRPPNFFSELKRRNVYKVAVAYAVVAWLLIQVATSTFPVLELPNWATKLVIALLVLGFPVALLFAWAFELTPEGLKRTEEVAPHQSVSRKTGRKLVALTAALAAVALALFLFQVVRSKTGANVTSSSTSSPSPLSSAIAEKSIAVLPFENLSEEKANAYFADGVQDEILTNLSRIADLKVISRTSVMQYRGTTQRNLREIGQQLGVAHVVEGSVQRADKRVRVNAQLIDARNDAHLWAHTYDRDLADVFAIQSEIAKAIAEQLQAKLSPGEKKAIEQPPTTDVAAFDLYSRARDLRTGFGAGSAQNLLGAVELLNQALARDPSFFAAQCELAEAHNHVYLHGVDHTTARLALAQKAVDAAFRLRPDAGEAHLARADHLYAGYLDYDRALAELDLARRTLPNNSRIFLTTGAINRRRGNQEEGLRSFLRAMELDPRNIATLGDVAICYEVLRRYSEAISILDRALAVRPDDAVIKAGRAFTWMNWKADTRPLHQVIDEIRAKQPAEVADLWFLCALAERDAAAAHAALAALGNDLFGDNATNFSAGFGQALLARMMKDEEKARSVFAAIRPQQEKIVQEQPDYGPAICVLALIDAGLGRKDEALREIQRARELMPLETDALNGADMIQYSAIVAAWVGEKDLACQQLATAVRLPGFLSYGRLKLLPWWDPLRGDPRFEEIVASLAPKEAVK
jgi:TolB-like protein/Flp pilus assembly protein TadD